MSLIGAARDLVFDVYLHLTGWRTATHDEADLAYKEGKIVNLVEKYPDIFGNDD